MLKFRKFVEMIEARSHPELNLKISMTLRMKDRLAKSTSLPGLPHIKNAFVSFTSLEKLGINPGSEFKTPLGIYSYPLTYVNDAIAGGEHPGDALPFAGNFEFANLFSAKGNIIDLNNVSKSEYDEYVEKILSNYPKRQKAVDKANKSTASFGQKLWSLTQQIANKDPVEWNAVFRKIGISGCYDKGEGIIHTNEPTQAVFFSIQSITQVERFDNNTYDNELNTEKNQTKIVNRFKEVDVLLRNGNITQDERDKHFIDFFESLDPKKDSKIFMILIKAFRFSDKMLKFIFDLVPQSFEWMSHPSEDLCLHVLDMKPAFIQYMKDPSERVQLKIASDSPYFVKFIENPTEKVQLKIASDSPGDIKYIKNPIDKIKKMLETP